MENNILVSIIIPVYNVRPYLAEALDSVLNQSYDNLEIIIIDDGSTDGSGELCDKYQKKDKRVRVIHQENRGISSTRNAGLEVMTGEVVAFLDSDDAYHPDYVRTMMTAMLRENADIVECKFTRHKTTGKMSLKGSEKKEPTAKPGRYGRVDALRALADGGISVNVWNKLYRKSLWREIRFPDGHVYEDNETAYRIIDLCSLFYVLNQPLYQYRKRPGSITDTKSLDNINDLLLAYTQVVSFIEAHTPEVFTSEQLDKHRRTHLNALFNYYFGLSKSNTAAEFVLSERLKQLIFEQEKIIGTESLSLRGRIACRMLRTCPELLHIAHAFYRPLRQLSLALFHR